MVCSESCRSWKDYLKKVLSIQKKADIERYLRLRRITQQVMISRLNNSSAGTACQTEADACRARLLKRDGTVELILAI